MKTAALAIAMFAALASTALAAGTPTHPVAQTWQQAKHNVGGYACVTSKAIRAKRVTWKSGAGYMTFIDFGAAYPSKAGLTVVVWNLDASRFQGHVVTACGEVVVYNGAVELSVNRMPKERN